MKTNNGKNIILDSDITMTKSHLGETLDEILSNQNSDIKELKRNVKFLYLYGGVGTHGGSGGGSSSSWKIYATLGSQQINNNIINLDGAKNYSLLIRILGVSGSGSSLFRIGYTYTNSKGTIEVPMKTVTFDNSYMITASIPLDINGIITIEAVDENGDPPESGNIKAEYITNPYTFELNFGNSEGILNKEENPTFYINSIERDGLFGYLYYNIGLNGIYTYSYTDFENILHEDEIDISDEKEGYIKLKLANDSFFINDNGGNYNLIVNIKVEREGYQNVTLNRSIKCNLVPGTLYLKIDPEDKNAVMYNEELEEAHYEFPLGSNGFYVQVYQGSSNLDRYYLLDYSITNELGTLNYTQLSIREKKSYGITFQFTRPGWNKLSFKVTTTSQAVTETYLVDKWVYVATSSSGLDWSYYSNEVYLNKGTHYKQYKVSNSGIETNTSSAVYEINPDNTIAELNNLFVNNIFTSSTSTSSKTVKFETPQNFDVSEILINISIQLSAINKSESKLISFGFDVGTDDSITIYQDKVEIGNQSISIFIPEYNLINSSNDNQFHLLTLYKRFYRSDNSNSYYEWNVYIDGSLEGSTSTFSTILKYYNNLTFYNANYLISHFDIIHYLRYSNGNLFDDGDITKYFYTFNTFRGIDDPFKVRINEIVRNNFAIDHQEDGVNTGMVTVTAGGLADLCDTNELCSILVLDVTDKKTYNDPSVKFSENFLLWYQRRIPESSGDTTGTKEVAVSYKPLGSKGLTQIATPQGSYFEIEKLGTSTKLWFAKNLTLRLVTKSETGQYIFTPNFEPVSNSDTEEEKKEKYNTFLPEQEFTLKKDVVDSAHANNNSIADFVNNNTDKFPTGDLTSKYFPYIKNCLTGFPCLVFVRASYEGQVTTTNIYYLGLYNFNLGRSSYYNLGYKSLKYIDNSDSNYPLRDKENGNIVDLTQGFNIYYTQNTNYKEGLMVAEIKQRDDYYDFSLYDESILFGANSLDPFVMWGNLVSNNEQNIKNQLIELVRRTSRAGGFIFDLLKKNYGTPKEGYNAVFTDIEKDNYNTSKNLVPDYKTLYKRVLNDSGEYEYKVNKIENPSIYQELLDSVLYNAINDTLPIINYKSLIEYYTIMMAFCMVDSIEKNLNVKSWNSGLTWYTAFYDMDTALGVDNSGAKTQDNAFSDYWTLFKDSTELLPASIFRDFSPETKVGDLATFDIPSSYLFAIAKYAKLILQGELINSEYPLSLWAKWRSLDGDLVNAKHFIDKYYAGRTKYVTESLMNYNYRATYLFKNPKATQDTITGYTSNDFQKFKGNKKYSTESWLNERFHIMDVYMGVLSNSTASSRYLQYLDLNDESWKILSYNNLPVVDLKIPKESTIFNNDDVIILKDIFSSSGSNKYPKVVRNVRIKALRNSFIVCQAPNSILAYMIIDPDKEYNFSASYNSGEAVTFGGSERWTSISDISQFIYSSEEGTTSGFYVNSTNLLNFIMKPITNVYNGTIGGYCPSVQLIQINGENYKSDLNITSDNQSFPGVLDINIDSSGINLTAELSSINSISALDMKSCRSININNCINLTNLEIGGIFTEKILVSRYDGDINFVGVSCPNIEISCTENSPKVFYMLDNGTITNLTLGNYSEITIKNCPLLEHIKLNNPGKILKITLSGIATSSTVTSFSVNSNDLEEDYLVDLSGCTNLEEICFYTSSGPVRKYKKLKMPNKVGGVKLSSSCFNMSGQLEEITNGDVYITGPNTFKNTSIKNLEHVKVAENTTNLLSTFDNYSSSGVGDVSNLNLTNVKTFLNNIQEINSITNISYMFRSLSKLEYDYNTYKSENSKTKCSLSLRKFKNVTNANGVFARTKISFCNRYIFTDLGSNKQGQLTASGILGNLAGDHIIKCTENSLEDLISNLKDGVCFDFFVSPNSPQTYATVHSVDSIISFVDELQKVSNFFKNKDKFIGMIGVNFDDEYDLSDVFDGWTNLRGIYCCLNNITVGSGTSSRVKKSSVAQFSRLGLYNLENLKYIYESFQKIKLTDDPYISLNSALNWSNFGNITTIDNSSLFGISDVFFNESNGLGKNWMLRNCFTNVPKKITIEDYSNILNVIRTSTYYKYIGNIFLNCYIINPNSNDIDPSINGERVINNNCIRLENTFDGIKIVALEEDIEENNTVPIKLDEIITSFPKCTIFKETFANINLSKTLPYNFFKRRYEKITDVYKKTSEEGEEVFTPIKYYLYLYTTDISSLVGCFKNTTISNNRYFKYDNLDENEKPLVNRLVGENEEILSDTSYYQRTTDTKLYEVSPNYEIEDAQNIRVHYTINNILIRNTTILNNSISDMQSDEYDNLLFIVPDILYGCSTGCDLTSCFEESDFAGALPKHMLNNKKFVLNNWITNTDILPQYVGTYSKTVEPYLSAFISDRQEIDLDVYVFVPENFCLNNTELNNAFNFYTRVPDRYALEETLTCYYIFLDTTFGSGLISLENSLPTIPKAFKEYLNQSSNHYSWYLANDALSSNYAFFYYNIMFNTSEIVGDKSGNDGFNNYKNLLVQNLFNSVYLGLGFGRLFKADTPLCSYKKVANKSEKAINYYGENTNKFLIFPTPASNKNLANTNMLYYITNSGGSNVRPTIYKALIQGNDDLKSAYAVNNIIVS